MTLEQELEYWRIEEQRLALARKAAWDKDPGNIAMAHLYLTVYDFHEAFKAWDKARLMVRSLEQKLATREAAE